MTRKLNTDNGLQGLTDRTPAGNSGFAKKKEKRKKRVQWLIEHSTSHQLLCYVDSFEPRNPLLRKAANRYFAEKKIPVMAYMAAMHKDYHRPGDKPYKVNLTKMSNVIRIGFLNTWMLANVNELK